ncbi:multicopper oxidase domain-containing protein [Nostoc sp. UHCC 0702]|nr:multicopper oxidase domain-containing protein [Nostoc sp. UHCC 0702]
MFKTSECNCHDPGLIRAWKMVAFAVCISVLMTFSAPSVQAAPAGSVVERPLSASVVENSPPAERVVENPPVLELRKKPIRPITRLTKPVGIDTKAEEVFDLKVVYTDSKLYNPATRHYDNVRLRSYVGTDTSTNTPYVAPTIEIKPGETVRINLNNQLPIDPRCINIDNQNQPHCINFNRTNLHSHGLWISPTGNSDNVLSVVDPGVKFQYEYNIPPDHPAGTFWYHPHLHGSTALQVASGMAGALIVRGDRLPREKTNGDIDTLLKEVGINPEDERILVLQQIQYACLDKNGAIKVRKEKDQNGQDQVVTWVCDINDKGVIEFYDDPGSNGLFGPRTWGQSGRYTSINGLILPTFKTESGRIERWRMIHAGVRDTISLRFRKLKEGAPRFTGLKITDPDSYIRENCTGDPIPYHVIADDGLTRSKAWKTDLTTLQPGYRSDALVIFPEPGDYCVVDASAPPSGTVNAQVNSRQLLGVVKAKAGTTVPYIDEKQGYNIGGSLKDQLVAAANKLDIPISIKERIVTDLKDNLKLTAFTPHLDIQDSDVTGKQELAFFIDLNSTPVKFEVSNAIGPNFAPKPYDGNRIDRNLTLGGVDEWTLESYFVSHPFHIHVNPFQIVKILDPKGNDVSLPGAIDNPDGICDSDPKQCDPQYPGLKGVWKDTLWIKSLVSTASQPGKIPPPTAIYKIVLRTRYQRYIGEFVIHCHILDHEDQGMMQNVNIVIPSGAGANSGSHS